VEIDHVEMSTAKIENSIADNSDMSARAMKKLKNGPDVKQHVE